jgi:hypothetical protein
LEETKHEINERKGGRMERKRKGRKERGRKDGMKKVWMHEQCVD